MVFHSLSGLTHHRDPARQAVQEWGRGSDEGFRVITFAAPREHVSPTGWGRRRQCVGWQWMSRPPQNLADLLQTVDFARGCHGFTPLTSTPSARTGGSKCTIRHEALRWRWCDCSDTIGSRYQCFGHQILPDARSQGHEYWMCAAGMPGIHDMKLVTKTTQFAEVVVTQHRPEMHPRPRRQRPTQHQYRARRRLRRARGRSVRAPRPPARAATFRYSPAQNVRNGRHRQPLGCRCRPLRSPRTPNNPWHWMNECTHTGSAAARPAARAAAPRTERAAPAARAPLAAVRRRRAILRLVLGAARGTGSVWRRRVGTRRRRPRSRPFRAPPGRWTSLRSPRERV